MMLISDINILHLFSRKKVTPGNENFDLLKEQRSVSMTDADDTFESESDDNPSLTHENVPDKNESNPSETGTYTVDKEDDSPTSPTTQVCFQPGYSIIYSLHPFSS